MTHGPKENTRIVLAFVTGCVSWLSFPSVGAWPLAFVAWVPLFFALEGATPTRAFGLSWIAGVTMTSLGFSFLMTTLTRYSGFSPPVCVLLFVALSAYQGLRVGLFGFLAARATARGWRSSVGLIAAFAASEVVVPLPFPWTFGASVHHVAVLAQVADLGGPITVSVVVIATNVGVFALIGAARGSATQPLAIGLLAAPLVASAYGVLRLREVDEVSRAAPLLRVGIVQANLTMMTHDEGAEHHVDRTQKLAGEGADLVVWSEAALPGPYPENDLEGALEAGVTSRLGTASVVGVTVRRRESGRRSKVFNSAVFARSDGSVTGRYDKRHLLPFGEYLPLGETWPILYEWSPSSGNFSPGGPSGQLSIGEHGVVATICYEDILSGYVRELTGDGAPDLLVNLTNDGWFEGTSEPRVHLALARLRAIEHRTFLVRATNSGLSAIIDPGGRITLSLPPEVEASAVGDAHWMHMHTVYESIGDAPWYACVALSFFMALAPYGAVRRRRRPRAR